VLILVAAVAIIWAAAGWLQQPEPLEQQGIGLALSLLATALNAVVAWILLKASRRFHSITLRADAHHLLTDVWTSFGVVLGIGLVKVTGLTILDPLIAIAVALNILFIRWKLLHETASGLLDRSLPEDEQATLETLLASTIAAVRSTALPSPRSFCAKATRTWLEVATGWLGRASADGGLRSMGGG
jgi:cation diffusion facilitator family transporter